ncbi:MAG: efflux RND transporter periplasmic adaptor subunit [Planctomycetaceae bacterium]
MVADDNKYRTLLRRTVISQIVIAVILAVGMLGFAALRAQKPGVESNAVVAAPLNIDAYAVQLVSFREIITAYGTAMPDREVVVGAQVSGEVVEVHPRLEVGQSVFAPHTVISADEPTRYAEGDVLVRVDERDYVNRARQSRNSIVEATRAIEQLRQEQTNSKRTLEKAKSDLQAFQQEYDRYRRAVALKAGAKSELNRALVEVNRHKDSIIQLENQLSLFPLRIAAAEERLAASQSENDRAQDDLERTRVLPPFDGFLSEVMVERGQFVRAGEPLFQLTDLDHIDIPVAIGLEDWRQVDASVNAGRHPSVELATSESVAADWTGAISRVAPKADPGSRTIQVFVTVNNQDQKHHLLPGTFVQARITGDVKVDQVVIPRTAILNDHVFVIDEDNTVRKQKITQGRRLRSIVVVTSGLTGSERIAITNLTLLENGLPVSVQNSTDLSGELQSQQTSVIEVVETGAESSLLESAHSATADDTVRE